MYFRLHYILVYISIWLGLAIDQHAAKEKAVAAVVRAKNIHIYLYIYIERERDIDMYMCIYIYIYILV